MSGKRKTKPSEWLAEEVITRPSGIECHIPLIPGGRRVELEGEREIRIYRRRRSRA